MLHFQQYRPYFETYEDDMFLHIVMEYIPGDNLFNMITNKVYVNLTERDIYEIMTCLLKSVLFLHHNNIVHRDINPIIFDHIRTCKGHQPFNSKAKINII